MGARAKRSAGEPASEPDPDAAEYVPARATAAPGRGSMNDLFGRGLIYIVIWSMQLVLATAVSPILAYLLGPDEFGSLAAAIALYQVLSAFALFGLDQAIGIQRVEDGADPQPARGLLAAGMGYVLIICAVAAVTAPWWGPLLGFSGPSSVALMWIALGWTLPGAMVMMAMGLLQAEDRLRQFTTVSVFASIGGQLIGLGLMLVYQRTAVVYAFGGVIAQMIALVLAIVWTRPRLAGLGERTVIRRGFQLGAPLLLTALALVILNAGDRFVIQRILGADEVGRFQIAFTIGYALVIVLSFANRAWVPRVKAIEDLTERWRVVEQSRNGLFRLVLPAILGIGVASPTLLRLLAPASFRPDLELALVVVVIAICAIPAADLGSTGLMLITLRRSRALAAGAVTAITVKLVLTIALVSLWDLLGAAIATLCAFSAQAVVQRRAIPPELGRTPTPGGILWTGLVVISVTIASLLLPVDLPWLVARFVVGVLCLPWFFWALRALQTSK